MINYARVRHGKTPRMDWKMLLICGGGALLALAIILLVSFAVGVQYRYSRYKVHLAESLVYARSEGSFQVLDGDEPATNVIGKDVFACLDINGRPVLKLPDEPAGLTVIYGDGSFTRLWETEYTDYSDGGGGTVVDGLILSHTYANGRTYSVSAPYDYWFRKAYLLGYVSSFYYPTLSETKLVEQMKAESRRQNGAE